MSWIMEDGLPHSGVTVNWHKRSGFCKGPYEAYPQVGKKSHQLSVWSSYSQSLWQNGSIPKPMNVVKLFTYGDS